MARNGERKHKFKLKNLIHRLGKMDILTDLVIDGKVCIDHKVGWVRMRGGTDPLYIAKARKIIQIAEDDLPEKPDLDEMKEHARFLVNASVVSAIESWDDEFFGEEFSIEYALDLFTDEQHFLIFNQLAHYMQEARHFLPNASQQQSNG